MEMVHKVTLSSGKVVLVREFKIKHQRLAARASSHGSGGDANVLSLSMIEEIIKQLILQIDGKEPAKGTLEDLDKLFTYQEYNQLTVFLKKMMGDTGDAPKVEAVSYGEQSPG